MKWLALMLTCALMGCSSHAVKHTNIEPKEVKSYDGDDKLEERMDEFHAQIQEMNAQVELLRKHEMCPPIDRDFID